jgi:alkylhydroperoxidase/carboxymuconolactone decarboxylase family protein YurZ
VRYQETLRRLAVIDEGVVHEQAGICLDVSDGSTLDAKTAALVQFGALVALGGPSVGLEWSVARALAAGASEDEIVDTLVILAAPVGLSRVVSVVTDVSTALGYDIEAELQ